MKKINKTVLLASTLFLSSAINLTNQSYASEDNSSLVKETLDSMNEESSEDQSPELESEAQLKENSEYIEQSYGEEDLGQEDTTNPVNLQTDESETKELETKEFKNNELESKELKNEDYEANNLENEELETNLEIDEKESAKESPALDKSEEDVLNANLPESSTVPSAIEEDGKLEEERIPGLIYYDDTNLDEGIYEAKYSSTEVNEVQNEQSHIEEENYYTGKDSGYFVKKNKAVKYYKNDKLVKNANIKVNERIYRTNNTGTVTKPSNKWLSVGKDIYYNNAKGEISRGITQIGKNKFYFSQDGVLERNKKLITSGAYYEVDKLGKMNLQKNKWVNVNKNIYRTLDNGKIAKGVTRIDDKDFMFDKDGKLQTNKKMIIKDKYYEVGPMGVITNPKNKWFALDGVSYRTKSDGSLAKGIYDVNGNTYVFKYDTGAMIVGRPSVTNGLYFDINDKGIATLKKDSWVTYEGKTFHTNKAGYIKKGVWEINGNTYCFDDNGLVINSTYMQNGIEYKTNKKGIANLIDYKHAVEKNLDYVIEWMFNAKTNGLTYNMGPARTSAKAADCSSAVFRSLIYGGFLKPDSFIGNTETLFAMGRQGQIMKEISESEIDYGDIFVSGIPGKSLGEGGHTGFILNNREDTIIHMNYSGNGVTVTPRKGYMGDRSGRPVKYYRLIGGKSDRIFVDNK